MTKLIDLSHRKKATDLLVDCANIAVWYGFPESSRLLVDWIKHRTDDASPVLWIDALRNMRFENFDEAKTILRGMLERDAKDIHAQALLVHILVECGENVPDALSANAVAEQTAEPGAQALLSQSLARRTKNHAARQKPAYGAVIA